MTETLTAAESLRLFGEIIRDQAGTILNPIDVILPRTDDATGPIVALVLEHHDKTHWVETERWVEITVTRVRPEPTPEQLARTTVYSRDEWYTAYWQLGHRDDWPDMVEWVRRGVYRPRYLPGIVMFLEIPAMTPEELKETLARFCSTPAPSAAWRTTWRDVIVPLLAPKAAHTWTSTTINGDRQTVTVARHRRHLPFHERKTNHEEGSRA